MHGAFRGRKAKSFGEIAASFYVKAQRDCRRKIDTFHHRSVKERIFRCKIGQHKRSQPLTVFAYQKTGENGNQQFQAQSYGKHDGEFVPAHTLYYVFRAKDYARNLLLVIGRVRETSF